MWYSSCVDLVNSRFLASEYAELGISGLRVTRVTRVHNRHLRNRFEERLEVRLLGRGLGARDRVRNLG